MNAVGVRIGQIVVRDVSEARLRTAFPDCEVAAIGADLQITFELRDLASRRLVLGHQSHTAMLQRIGFARTASAPPVPENFLLTWSATPGRALEARRAA